MVLWILRYLLLQEIARGGGGGVADAVNLDIHAIAELQKQFPPTNDKPKYKYASDDQGNYSEFRVQGSRGQAMVHWLPSSPPQCSSKVQEKSRDALPDHLCFHSVR